MSEHYDREGKPISFERWALLFEDKRYQLIRQDTVGPYLVSTVWLGFDHGWDNTALPIIFETMVFKAFGDDLDQVRYATEAEALIGHAKLLNEVALLYEAARATSDDEA